MDNIIQMGLYRNDDYALTPFQGKWVKVPLWVWAEWELPGGVQAIINEWQRGLLMTYGSGGAENYMGFRGFLDVEREALDGIQKEAVMLRRYLSGKPVVGLNREERMVLELETRSMLKSAHMKGDFLHDWIANEMTHKTGSIYTIRHIRAILDDISYILKASYDMVLQEKMQSTLKVLAKVWNEAANEIVVTAA